MRSNSDKLASHNLVCTTLETREVRSSFARLADEGRDVFEQIPIRDHACAFAFVAFDDEVVVLVFFEHIADVLDRIVHRDGFDGLSHDVVDDEWFQCVPFCLAYRV